MKDASKRKANNNGDCETIGVIQNQVKSPCQNYFFKNYKIIFLIKLLKKKSKLTKD